MNSGKLPNWCRTFFIIAVTNFVPFFFSVILLGDFPNFHSDKQRPFSLSCRNDWTTRCSVAALYQHASVAFFLIAAASLVVYRFIQSPRFKTVLPVLFMLLVVCLAGPSIAHKIGAVLQR